MTKPTPDRLKRQYAQGVPMRRICHQYGVNMTELRTILGMPPRAKRQSSPLTREERQAIADLRDEGYSDAAIEAVFGDCLPPTQAEWDNCIGDGA